MYLLERANTRPFTACTHTSNNMQFGFMHIMGTTDVIFIMRQIQEKHQAEKKKLNYAFVDLEKAFDSPKRGGEMGFEEAGCG